LGHLFYSLGCFLLDLLPYRNKSDSLYYFLPLPAMLGGSVIYCFRDLNILIKLYSNSPKLFKCCTSFNLIKAILIYISQKTSYRQTRFVCHYYTHLFRDYCYNHLFSHIFLFIYLDMCRSFAFGPIYFNSFSLISFFFFSLK